MCVWFVREVVFMISYVVSLFAGIGLWTAIGVTLVAGLMRGFAGFGSAMLMALELRWPLARGIGVEPGRIDTGILQQRHDRAAILVVELALEEARKGEIDQGAAMAAP